MLDIAAIYLVIGFGMFLMSIPDFKVILQAVKEEDPLLRPLDVLTILLVMALTYILGWPLIMFDYFTTQK